MDKISPRLDLRASSGQRRAPARKGEALFAGRFPRTLDRLLRRFRDGAPGPLEIWSFDDRAARASAERAFARRGVAARCRSAYKPLLHAFLEELDTKGLLRAEIHYPRHLRAAPERFRLESYPLSALYPETEFVFLPRDAEEGLTYRVALEWSDGRRAAREVFAPNRPHADSLGAPILSPTGWLKIGVSPGERLETELEALFAAALAAVSAQDWRGPEPWFEELNLRALIPTPDGPLAHGEEAVSLSEALHEDLYFALHELLRARGCGGRPGQIVPEIGLSKGRAASLRIEARPLAAHDPPPFGPEPDLDALESPISPSRIRHELALLGGERFTALSRAGRLVEGVYLRGFEAPMRLSAGQHANETTGIVGALRAARSLARRPGVHLALSPLENPDGYALHRRLIGENPRHMHHAARYTACGDDLEGRMPRRPPEEALIRERAHELCEARLHVNLHGYPSHEWTRPFSGYLPRGFEAWTIPKGFFLILRHHRVATDFALALLARVTRDLAADPQIMAFNAAQIRVYESSVGEASGGFQWVNGFPCLIGVEEAQSAAVQLVTEFPDETLHGPAFRFGHESQKRLVLAAYEALQALSAVS